MEKRTLGSETCRTYVEKNTLNILSPHFQKGELFRTVINRLCMDPLFFACGLALI